MRTGISILRACGIFVGEFVVSACVLALIILDSFFFVTARWFNKD